VTHTPGRRQRGDHVGVDVLGGGAGSSSVRTWTAWGTRTKGAGKLAVQIGWTAGPSKPAQVTAVANEATAVVATVIRTSRRNHRAGSRTFDPEAALGLIEAERLTWLPGPPTVYPMLMDSPARPRHQLAAPGGHRRLPRPR
jgi:hypothetical protein